MSSIPYISQNWLKNYDVNKKDMKELFGMIQYWSDRSCGLACLLMALKGLKNTEIKMHDIFNAAIRIGAYSQNGWIHYKLAELSTSFGLPSQALKIPLDDVLDLVNKGAVFIASIRHKFPVNAGKGGHLVLVYKYKEHAGKKYIFFRDPSRWGETHNCITIDRFNASYSSNGIILGIHH
ncbi:cysteine peptidase family C39 domain-containing protein [Dickeya chrysanthemi]|uniref:Cysteine peptidase family C39 domain-containing protein n=1 Tax=Dickeya chrysanthemi TaxID=556 RepID=A0ABU8JNE2_DICCH|nr:cysteine peptidase family C39 domain-containing protein [Dickeya chrysanthemi]